MPTELETLAVTPVPTLTEFPLVWPILLLIAMILLILIVLFSWLWLQQRKITPEGIEENEPKPEEPQDKP